MRNGIVTAMMVVLAACGGRMEGGAPGGGNAAGAGQLKVPLVWTGPGNAPRLALVWQTLLGEDFDFHEQLLLAEATDLSTLDPAAVVPPSDGLVPSEDFSYRYAQAMVLAVEDVDGDGTIIWDGFKVLPPDSAVGVAPHHMLFYTKANPDSGLAAPLKDGLHLGTLDFCGSGAVLEVALDTPFQVTPIPEGLSPDDTMDTRCSTFGPEVAAGNGEGPCSADVSGESCGTCTTAAFDTCRTETCAAGATTLGDCAREAACIAADGKWDTACATDACEAQFRAYDDCLYGCWNPYACF